MPNKVIVECHFVTGKHALLIKLFCFDHDHLMQILLNTIQKTPKHCHIKFSSPCRKQSAHSPSIHFSFRSFFPFPPLLHFLQFSSVSISVQFSFLSDSTLPSPSLYLSIPIPHSLHLSFPHCFIKN
ncbi:MAG: Lrp/AsnC ligand binding domain-containing protein [Bacteroidales bacterium]|nr:Lrp/AsnC ligand binding domain-containing protein [Bacteroidales bacterium]